MNADRSGRALATPNGLLGAAAHFEPERADASASSLARYTILTSMEASGGAFVFVQRMFFQPQRRFLHEGPRRISTHEGSK
jgi:hypothetical protein